MRRTLHPRAFSKRLTFRSRARLPSIFAFQKAARVFGQIMCLGQPCQKQPSTSTAVLP